MTATKTDIERWLETAKVKRATHLIVAVDRFDHDNYPVYVLPGQDVGEKVSDIREEEMQGVDEVYNMSMDIDEQLAEYRAMNY